LRQKFVQLLGQLKSSVIAPDGIVPVTAIPGDDLQAFLTDITSLLMSAVDARFAVEMRHTDSNALRLPSSFERFDYLVKQGFAIRDENWGLLVALRALYMHRVRNVLVTLPCLVQLSFVDRERSLSGVGGSTTIEPKAEIILLLNRVAQLFDELLEGPSGTHSTEDAG
jgi:hypothetical protein